MKNLKFYLLKNPSNELIFVFCIIIMSQNAFNQKKQSILYEINSVQPDLSPKGSIDSLCLPIINLINSHNDMVTTSSCSGRISVFVEGTKQHDSVNKTGGKGQGGKWLYVSHDQDQVVDWVEKLKNGSGPENQKIVFNQINEDAISVQNFDSTIRYVLYKYEPFILHVKCRDFNIASKLYNVAMSCGFRESGIGSNNIVAVRINIKLDVPIGYVEELIDSEDYKLNLFVSENYIKILDRLTLSKFEDNKRKMDELYEKINKEIILAEPIVVEQMETKEERRERKRREGLARQQISKGK